MSLRTIQKACVFVGFVFVSVSVSHIFEPKKNAQCVLHAKELNGGEKVKWETAIRELGDPQKGDVLALIQKIQTLIDRAKSSGDESEKNLVFNKLSEHVKKHEDPNVRRRSVFCLSAFGKDAAQVVKSALHSDQNRRVRAMAARILGRVGGEEALDSLYSAIVKDKGVFGQGRNIASAAITAIGEIGGERASETLLKLWQENISRSEQTLMAMGEAGHVRAVALLEEVLKANQEMYRDNALHALGQIASRNRNDLGIVKKVRVYLLKGLKDENPNVRRNAVFSLSLIGEPGDIPLLEEMLQDSYTTVVGYMENGQRKTKEVYRIREEARNAIERLQARLRRDLAVDTSPNQVTSPVVEVKERLGLSLLGYILIPGVIALCALGTALLIVKKKAASRRK